MPTINIRQINGVVRTSEPVWSNLERLAEAASVWFTYDTHNGVYSWVINEAGDTEASITEADIIGPIQISGSGLTNLYNAVEIEYPRNDLNDQPHYARVELPDALRNQYEPDNTLQMTSEFINNQPQAEYVAMVNLKQSRLDRTVTIIMDYSKINLQAGDIIDITSPTYGWISKEFRIMRVREIEGDDGSLRLEFSCTEYDDTIYDGTWNNFLVGGVPGIRAIGAIGQPATPTIALTTVNSLPAQTVTTTVPEGVVDRVQFWAGNVLITGNVANTDFNLVGSVASTDALSFTAGDNVEFNTVSLPDGTWAWKTRGTNGGGTGPFSNVSANVEYVRGQAPDLIIIGTPIVDDDGVTIPGDTVSITQGGRSFSSIIADEIQFTGNSVFRPMIYTSGVFIIPIGNANVSTTCKLSPVVLPAANGVLSLDHSCTVLDIDRAALGINPGQALYYSQAQWNQASYDSTGFENLSWTDWNLIGVGIDSTGSLTGNIRHTTSTDAVINLANSNGNVIAFGVTSTRIPASWGDISQNANGVITSTVAFSTNTVILEEDKTTGVDTYRTPGITAGRNPLNGAADSWLNYRFLF